MKRFRTLLLVALMAVFTLSFPAQANEMEPNRTVNGVSLRVQLDPSYRYEYGHTTAASQALNDVYSASQNFEKEFGLYFNPTVVNVYGTPASRCIDRNSLCTDVGCGSPCSNDPSTNIHHKNLPKNMYYLRDNFPLGSYDLNLGLFGGRGFCAIYSGVHDKTHAGYANAVYGTHAVTRSNDSQTQIRRVRVIQHELSHLFGCRDNVCTSGQECVMNYGFTFTPLVGPDAVYNVWCDRCFSDFNPFAH